MNLCFEKILNILSCVFDDHAPIKKLLKKEKSLTDKPWTDKYLRHLKSIKVKKSNSKIGKSSGI